MEVACDDRYHCKQVLGFFVRRNGKLKSPRFSIVSNRNQNGCIVVKTIDGCDVGVRLVLLHVFGRRRARIVGFTSERNEKSEYFFEGFIPFGRILIIPVEGHDRIENPRPDYPYEDYVTVFKEVDGCFQYTRRAEDALEYLFEVLDADNNGFLSASEMSVFKEFLGLGHSIAEDEWSDALFGWQDGDLDYTLTEMSSSFFKSFIARLCEGYFSFAEDRGTQPETIQQETSRRMPIHARRIRNLEKIFECFAFDKDLSPSVSQYSIRIYTERNSMSEFSVIPQEKITSETAIRCITKVFGERKKFISGLTLYILQCTEWLSIVLKNSDADPKEVSIEVSIVIRDRGVLQPEPGFSWKKVVPGDSEMVAGRFSIIGGICEDFVLRCNVPGTENDVSYLGSLIS